MFTGIVEEVGAIQDIQRTGLSCRLKIACHTVLEGTRIGDSIAVNGTCLTVTELESDAFWADMTPETLSRTSFSQARGGSRVNLERALRPIDRMGGHIVLGHVDTTGQIRDMKKSGNSVEIAITAGSQWMRYIALKGSVAVEGISLTVAKRERDSFMISLIPHTGMETTLLLKKPGDAVNIECDYLGKLVEQLMDKDPAEGLTMSALRTLGGNRYGI
ncbi:MAG: riboflavin synthase [Dialister sp.]|nr:riboflavin synthase [Dialister sp.]